MPEMSALRKDRTNDIILYPYKDIPEDKWPVYPNTKGEKVPYDEGWREIGFVLPYPYVKHLNDLGSKFSEMVASNGETIIRNGDPESMANTFVYQKIKDVRGLTDNGQPVSWASKSVRDWVFGEFKASAWLLNTLFLAYVRFAGELKSKESENEENFTELSAATSSTSTMATPLRSDAVSEPTGMMPSCDE